MSMSIAPDKSLGSRFTDIVLLLTMVLVIIATAFPMFHIAVVSVSDGRAVLRQEVSVWPVSPTLDAYRIVFSDASILRALANSALYTSVGTIISLILTSLCAYPLARPFFSGRKFGTWMVTITLFFSGGLIPLYLLVLNLGLINTIWAIVLPGAITPWYVFIMRAFFMGIPKDIFDAATVDGANEMRIFWQIALPLSKPILATLLLFYAVQNWNDFFQPLIFLNDKDKFPLQLLLRSMLLEGSYDQSNQVGAGSDFAVVPQTLKYATIMVSTLPIILVYPFVQKYFVKGVMIGSLKG